MQRRSAGQHKVPMEAFGHTQRLCSSACHFDLRHGMLRRRQQSLRFSSQQLVLQQQKGESLN